MAAKAVTTAGRWARKGLLKDVGAKKPRGGPTYANPVRAR